MNEPEQACLACLGAGMKPEEIERLRGVMVRTAISAGDEIVRRVREASGLDLEIAQSFLEHTLGDIEPAISQVDVRHPKGEPGHLLARQVSLRQRLTAGLDQDAACTIVLAAELEVACITRCD